MQRRALVTLALAPLAAIAPALRAQPAADPLAALGPAQWRAVQQFLKKNSQGNQGSAQADQAELADVDGDGSPELVLLWTLMGPTFASSRVALFKPAGGAWKTAASANALGQVQRMRLAGREILIDTLMPGPKDARCCPTLKQVQRIRWADGRLVSVD